MVRSGMHPYESWICSRFHFLLFGIAAEPLPAVRTPGDTVIFDTAPSMFALDSMLSHALLLNKLTEISMMDLASGEEALFTNR